MSRSNGIIAKPHRQLRRADQYNDPGHNYLRYWEGREYEHAAEEIAIRRLLKGRHFGLAVDIGGGYGRLSLLLGGYADKVVLAEPSQQQLDMAEDYLKGHPEIEMKQMQADDLKFADGSVGLVTMVRVMHHLPDPVFELAEIARVLSDDGYAIIEVANYTHMRNRIKFMLKRQKLPVKPVDIRSPEHQREDEIPFVNHNPKTVMRQLSHAGLQVRRVLSVSNLRSPKLKQKLPLKVMVGMERALQVPLAPALFGPSIFFLVKKQRS